LQLERATNIELQEQLHSANEKLRMADGGSHFDLDRRDQDKHDRRSLRQRKLGKGQAQTSCRWPLGLTFLPTLLATADAVVDKSFAALHMSARGT
jgi:hypothetical protein